MTLVALADTRYLFARGAIAHQVPIAQDPLQRHDLQGPPFKDGGSVALLSRIDRRTGNHGAMVEIVPQMFNLCWRHPVSLLP